MKEKTEYKGFDTKIAASDWRYSAAIVGLLRYFNRFEIDYIIEDEYLFYNSQDIEGEEANKRYLAFVEEDFESGMHHRVIENILQSDDITEEKSKIVNEKLSANSICKKVFGKLKYSEENKNDILSLIEERREELIQETFRSAKSMYAKFANPKKLFSEADKVCRLLNYYVDLPKKSKSMAYNWNYDTFVSNDVSEFDFIPFAFSKTRDGYFINNNYSIRNLYFSNVRLQEEISMADEERKKNPRLYLFRMVKNSSTFLDYEVEVIHKDQEKEYYETLFVRKRSIEIFKKINEKMFAAFERPFRLNSGDYFPMVNEITDRILNLMHLDDIIQMMLRDYSDKIYLIKVLIQINQYIYGGENMDVKTYYAREAAFKVAAGLKKKGAENKIKSYQQKLTSAITFKNYDKYCEILLQLTSYIDQPLDFAYDLFDDFDANKNIAYAFALGLSGKSYEEKKDDENQEGEE